MTTASGDSGSAASDAGDRLTGQLLDALWAQPLEALLPPPLLARLLRQGAVAALRSPQFTPQLQAVLLVVQRFLTPAEPSVTRLRDLLPAEIVATARKLVMHPYTPERGLITAAFSREPLRRLNRELMVSTLLSYGRRIRSSINEAGGGKGLGALGRLASAAVSKGSSAIGSLAGGVAAVVGDELERQLQRRASEFADAAVEEVVQQIATTLTDPAQAAVQRELKLAMFDYLLDLRPAQLGHEMERFQPLTVATTLRDGLLSWLESPTAEPALTELIVALTAHNRGKSLGDLLPDSALRAPVQATLQALLGRFLTPLLFSGQLHLAP